MSKMVKALLDGQASATVINSRDIVNEAVRLHGLSPVAAAALGRTLTMASIMGSGLKGKTDRLTITISGGGELGRITVCSDTEGCVKGYVGNPDCPTYSNEKGKLDVGRAVGREGTLTVIKDLGLKNPFNASTQLVSGEIAEDFAMYFLKSEQTRSTVALGVLEDTDGKCLNAAGIFVFLLPGCSDKVIGKLECYLGEMAEVSVMVPEDDPAEFLKGFFDLFDVEIIEEREVFYRCDCSEERISAALKSLGRKECMETLDKEGKIEVVCRFCNKKYVFDREKTESLFSERLTGNEE